MTKIVFECAYADKLLVADGDIAGATFSTDGLFVTVTFSSAVDTFTIAKLAQQARVKNIWVYTA